VRVLIGKLAHEALLLPDPRSKPTNTQFAQDRFFVLKRLTISQPAVMQGQPRETLGPLDEGSVAAASFFSNLFATGSRSI